jgi:predicted nuclease with TOPRIM domain
MKSTCLLWIAASLGICALGGCTTASSVEGTVNRQEKVAQIALECERQKTNNLLRERSRLEGRLSDVRSRRAATTDAEERSRLRQEETRLSGEIQMLQDQLNQLSRN